MSNVNDTPKGKLKEIPIAAIRESQVALRSVDLENESFIQLVDSIRSRGVLNAILVREQKDEESGKTYYGLVDGLQRYTASMRAGRQTIPAIVMDLDDAEVLETQIITNVHRIETKPVEYSKQLIRILALNPLMPVSVLADKLNRSPAWISERLGLVKLDDAIQPLVDEGKINLSNAYALAKLPNEEQASFVDRAISMTPQEFVPTVNQRVKEIRDAKRQGRDPGAVKEFVPVPFLQKLSALKEELAVGQVAPVLIATTGVKTAEEGFKLGLEWALHLDPLSVEAAKAKAEQRKQEEAAAKERRKAEKEEAKRQEAAKIAASL